MVAVSLLHYLRDRRQLIVLAIAFAALLVALGLLGFVVLLAAGMVESSLVEVRFVAPFRWEQSEPITLA